MPKLFHCHECGERITKSEAIVSRYTERAYCRNERACRHRQRRNARTSSN